MKTEQIYFAGNAECEWGFGGDLEFNKDRQEPSEPQVSGGGEVNFIIAISSYLPLWKSA